jgi:hypothetical protein
MAKKPHSKFKKQNEENPSESFADPYLEHRSWTPINIRNQPVVRIRIRRIRMFLGLLDSDPDPL